MENTNKALDFVRTVCTTPELAATAQSIPEVFIEQVRKGYTEFFVNTDLVSDAAFTRSGDNNNYLRIELRDCIVQGPDEISFKLKLSGIMNYANGQLTNMKPGGTMGQGEGWIKGFISNRVAISQEDVDAGLLSQQCFDLLKKYAAWWEGVVTTEGTSAPYKKYARNRLWLAASNEQFLFTFQMEERNNPTPRPGDLAVVVGLTDMTWKCAHFTNTAPSLSIGRIGVAGGVGRGNGVNVPPVSRAFSPRETPEEQNVTAPAFAGPNREFNI